VQTSHGHHYGVNGVSSSTSRSNDILRVCQGEGVLGQAGWLGILERDSEESAVQTCRVAGLKSGKQASRACSTIAKLMRCLDISNSLPDTAIPSDISDDAASDSSKKEHSSGGSGSDSSRNGPAHQCSSECEPFSAELHCVEAWVRDVCRSNVEASELGAHGFEHQDGRFQEGGLPCTSETVNLSSPPAYRHAPRVATLDTQGSEAASVALQLGILFRSIVDELYKLTDSAQKNHDGDDEGPDINSRAGGVFEESQDDEHILERAEQTGLLAKPREEPVILSPRIAEPKSGTKESTINFLTWLMHRIRCFGFVTGHGSL